MENQLKVGQVYSIIKHSFNSECAVNLSFCTLKNRKEWINDVATLAGCKAVGAFIIRSIKKQAA